MQMSLYPFKSYLTKKQRLTLRGPLWMSEFDYSSMEKNLVFSRSLLISIFLFWTGAHYYLIWEPRDKIELLYLGLLFLISPMQVIILLNRAIIQMFANWSSVHPTSVFCFAVLFLCESQMRLIKLACINFGVQLFQPFQTSLWKGI